MTIYAHGGSETIYGPGQNTPTDKRGDEYKYFLWVLDLLRRGLEDPDPKIHCFNFTDPKFINDRFGPATTNHLIPEQARIDSFPDFVTVRDELILVFDHFKVDAAKHRIKKDRDLGSIYIEYIKKQKDKTVEEIQADIETGMLEFSTSNLFRNICSTFDDHACKTEKYDQAVIDYILDSPNQVIAHEDSCKPLEHWFLIEDVTPTSDLQTIERALNLMFEYHPNIAGVIYTHNPIPKGAPENTDEICIFKNPYTE